MPERSRTCGEPNVPDEITTSLLARMTLDLVASALGWNVRLGIISTPVARLFLKGMAGSLM